VLVIGSEVPNLLENDAASTLVVSEDVDIGVPVGSHAGVKLALTSLDVFEPSAHEPSVWVPRNEELIEVNFVGMNPQGDVEEPAFVLEDATLPLLVFGYLSFLRLGRIVQVDGVRIPLPRPAGLMLEKLVTDRTGVKGDRDLLVVMGLLLTAEADDVDEFVTGVGRLSVELRQAVLSNLTVLSLMSPHAEMPDPTLHRQRISEILSRLDGTSDRGGAG
jgi:hypothetical protein